MGLFEKLQALGCHLRLVQVVPRTQAVPEKIQTRSVTLQELITEVEAGSVQSLADSPVELAIAYDNIFASAGIQPAPGQWTIERLNELLETSPYNTLRGEPLLKAVVEKLAAENVSAEALVKDALAKDKALDAFETFVCEKMNKRALARQKSLAEIGRQIEQLQRDREKLEQEDRQENQRLSEWRQHKQTFENKITKSVDLLTLCSQNSNGKSK